MSPSKTRKSSWYREGETARMLDLPRDSNPYLTDPAHYVRRRAWWTGWDDANAAELHKAAETEPDDLLDGVAEYLRETFPGVAADAARFYAEEIIRRVALGLNSEASRSGAA